MAEKNILKALGENPTRRQILEHWNPENEEFWNKFGEKIAKQNLYVSTWALTLTSMSGLVGATCRLFYTYMPGIVGGKNWTLFSTALLLLSIIGLGGALQDTSTSYDTFFMLVAGIGVAGGNFSSSMANIGFFFPKK